MEMVIFLVMLVFATGYGFEIKFDSEFESPSYEDAAIWYKNYKVVEKVIPLPDKCTLKRWGPYVDTEPSTSNLKFQLKCDFTGQPEEIDGPVIGKLVQLSDSGYFVFTVEVKRIVETPLTNYGGSKSEYTVINDSVQNGSESMNSWQTNYNSRETLIKGSVENCIVNGPIRVTESVKNSYINGPIRVTESVKRSTINGKTEVGGSVEYSTIQGPIRVTESVKHSTINGKTEVGGSVEYSTIQGPIRVTESVVSSTINGKTEVGGSVEYSTIDGPIRVTESVVSSTINGKMVNHNGRFESTPQTLFFVNGQPISNVDSGVHAARNNVVKGFTTYSNYGKFNDWKSK